MRAYAYFTDDDDEEEEEECVLAKIIPHLLMYLSIYS